MKKFLLRTLLKAFEIDDELLDSKCKCSVCKLLRQALGLVKLVE